MKMPFLKWENRGNGENREMEKIEERERTALYLFDPMLTEWMKWEVTTHWRNNLIEKEEKMERSREKQERWEETKGEKEGSLTNIFGTWTRVELTMCVLSLLLTHCALGFYFTLSLSSSISPSLPRVLPLFLMFPSPFDIFLLLPGLTNQQPEKRVTAPGSPSEPLNGIDRKQVLIPSSSFLPFSLPFSFQLHPVSEMRRPPSRIWLSYETPRLSCYFNCPTFWNCWTQWNKFDTLFFVCE